MPAHLFRTFALSLSTMAAFGLAACSGGGSSPNSTPRVKATTAPVVKKSPTKLGITLGGKTSTLSRAFHKLSVQDTPVVVSFNGATVATGTLDKDGFSELTFTQPVPADAAVLVTIGTGANAIVASVSLVDAASATAALLTYDPGPPAAINVQRAEDNADNGHYDGSQGENESENENAQNGQVGSVSDSNDGLLPSNLPIIVTGCADTLTVGFDPSASPAPSGAYALEFQEKASDDEVNSPNDYHVDPFSSPVTFPIVSNESRLRIDLTQNGKTVLTLQAPLGSFSPNSDPNVTPAACPTVSPTTAPHA